MSENSAKSYSIEIEGIKKNYGHIEALRGVDMQIEKGSIFGLLGPNGAGKTTLIKILVGSSRPNAGVARVLGFDPFKDPYHLRRYIGYMPQAPALYDDLSARDNIRFFGSAHYLPDLDRRVNEVLEFTALSTRGKDPVGGYSGGMKQRVSLACALVHRPRALFLDEPTAGVDPKLKELFWQHFRELAAQGITLFISTHLMDEALLCDKLAIMQEGKVLVCDTPRNIMLRGNTQVKVWRGNTLDEYTVTEYPTQLPEVLAQYHLDRSVTRLELEQDTLETILLRIINHQQEQQTTSAELEKMNSK
ncbi:MAG TPA: ABC transporter ATP-binding protein [Chloroflexia bacterium]|nr:ABC transporter ATP-binding protein [Chloroflexia bacterium]